MSWQDVRNAIELAVQTAGALTVGKVIWAWQNTEEPELPFVTLELGSILGVGRDGRRTTTDLRRPAGQEVISETLGNREVTMTVSAFTSATATADDALGLVEYIRGGLRQSVADDILSPVGVSLFDLEGAAHNMPEVVGTAFRGRAMLPVRLYAPADAMAEYFGYIASVKGTTTATEGGTVAFVKDYTAP